MPALLLLSAAATLAAELSGQVLGAPDGEPLAGATVAAFDQQLDYTLATTAEDGSFTLTGLPAGTWRLWAIPASTDNHVARFLASDRDFCSSTALTLGEDDAVAGADFTLPAGATASGFLVDSAGDPVSGATVRADPVDDDGYVVSRSATTDEDGSFSLVGLDAPERGSAEWTCAVSAEGWPDQYLGPTYDDQEAVAFTVEDQGQAALGEHMLLDGILVSGTVRGPGGPVAGATVYVYSSSQIVGVETGADGTYEAVGLPPGSVLPWVSTAGLAMTYYPDADRPTEFITAEEEGEVVEGADLEAPAEAVFRAVFEDATTGERIHDVTGLLYNDTRTVGRGNSADEEGLLAIDRLHGGAYTLYVWAADQGHADDWIREADGSERIFVVEGEVENDVVTLALPRAAALSGTVRDDAGAPVHGVTVRVVRDDGEWDQVSADRDGTWRIDGLPAGSWALGTDYDAWCPGDPGFVDTWWPGQVNEDWLVPLVLDEGEWLEGIDLVVPRDDDHDEMGDAWETAHGLDPSRDDATEDPDGDGYSNLEEYRLGTDPLGTTAAATCGCGAAGSSVVPLLLLPPWLRRRRRAS